MSQTLVREQSAVEMQPMLWLSFARKGGVCLRPFCAELRGFAAKIFQTVETTVNDHGIARARNGSHGKG